jgi:hypothetical protein
MTRFRHLLNVQHQTLWARSCLAAVQRLIAALGGLTPLWMTAASPELTWRETPGMVRSDLRAGCIQWPQNERNVSLLRLRQSLPTEKHIS